MGCPILVPIELTPHRELTPRAAISRMGIGPRGGESVATQATVQSHGEFVGSILQNTALFFSSKTVFFLTLK